MAKNVTVTWDLPTTRESTLPLPLAEIDAVEIGMGVTNTNFTNIDRVLSADAQSSYIPDVATGDWFLQLIVFDTDGRPSAPVVFPFNVPDETPPGMVGNVTVILE